MGQSWDGDSLHSSWIFYRENADPSIPVWGAISGAVASFVERYEFGPIDDNVLIVIASSLIIALGVNLGPI